MVLSQHRLILLMAAFMLMLGACLAVVPVTSAGPGLTQTYQPFDTSHATKPQLLQFDVAEYVTRFIFEEGVIYENGVPMDGVSFVTRGYLYEYGTLKGRNGVNADGTPEFPDKVIGEWICQGYMINDVAHAIGDIWVFSNQFFQFGDEVGAKTIVTQGYELADINVDIARAITGGTGEYKMARGESTQTLLGINATHGVNLRVQIAVQK